MRDWKMAKGVARYLKELFGELNVKIVEAMPMWMKTQAAIKQ